MFQLPGVKVSAPDTVTSASPETVGVTVTSPEGRRVGVTVLDDEYAEGQGDIRAEIYHPRGLPTVHYGQPFEVRANFSIYPGSADENPGNHPDSGRIGARFLDEAARAMRVPAFTDRLEPPMIHDLARAYPPAGAEAPPELVQHLIGQMDELTKSGRLPLDPDSEIERMREVLDLDEHYLHRKLDERIGVLPEELRAAFAYEVACRDEAVCGRIAMYWLLDDSAEVRLAAAEGFRERARREIVEPVSAALVPLIRNWMPADAGRTLLDEALAEARRRELVAPLPRPERRRAEIYGSIPDKWGTQMLRAVLQGTPAIGRLRPEARGAGCAASPARRA